MKNVFTPEEICNCIRHINCMSEPDFIDVFGQNQGDHLWHKFENDYKKEVGKLLVTLDLGNQRLLFTHCREFLDERK